jgi:acetyltransferase EpsM
MADPYPIIIPLINPNEPGALLASLNVTPGQHVCIGDRLCTLETTKSTIELIAEADGFFVGSAHEAGETVQAGVILGYLADSPDWSPPRFIDETSGKPATHPNDIHISKPALLLAKQINLDLALLQKDVFITERMIQELIDRTTQPAAILQDQDFDPDSIIVFGGGGHGKALIDLLRVLGIYPIAGIVDDDPTLGSEILGVPVLGGGNILTLLTKRGVHLAVNAVGGIGNIQSRITVFEQLLRAGFTCPALVHPTAFVEASAKLADGVQVMPHAYIGSDAQVGFGAIINTGAIVSHDCRLGDYANLSPGAILAGEVNVGSASLIGMGVTVNLRVNVGENTRIGNGATVKQDVPAGSIVHAGTIWPS